MGVQELLDNPNNSDAAQDGAYRLFKRSKVRWIEPQTLNFKL